MYIIGGIYLNYNENNEHSKYIITGMIIGLFFGVLFSIIMKNNVFFSIASPGLGLSLGLLISNVIFALKK